MLTKKQFELLTFINRRLSESGVSPSFEEMKEALGLKSKSGIHRLITGLEERGFIKRLAHRARALEVTRLPEQASRPDQRPAAPQRGFAPNVKSADEALELLSMAVEKAGYQPGQQVFFALDVSPIKDEYTLAYTWDGTRQVTWTLVEGKMLRSLDGAYELRDNGNGTTEVTYRLALDVSIPLIGMLKRKGEKILIDTALKGLKKRVESL